MRVAPSHLDRLRATRAAKRDAFAAAERRHRGRGKARAELAGATLSLLRAEMAAAFSDRMNRGKGAARARREGEMPSLFAGA